MRLLSLKLKVALKLDFLVNEQEAWIKFQYGKPPQYYIVNQTNCFLDVDGKWIEPNEEGWPIYFCEKRQAINFALKFTN